MPVAAASERRAAPGPSPNASGAGRLVTVARQVTRVGTSTNIKR